MLFRKAVRAIWANKRSYLACMFLIAIGVLMFTAMNTAGAGLASSALGFYRDYGMSDIFARVDAIPVGMTERLTEADGIEAAEARYILEVMAETPDEGETVTMRLISADPRGSVINRLLIEGSEWSAPGDIILNPAFVKAHGLVPGDEIRVIYKGRTFIFTFCATALSPENIYVTKNATDLLPDNSGFGIGYITPDSMASLTNAGGVGNSVVLTLTEGYTFDEVKVFLEDALTPYGLKELIDKKDHLSYSFVDLEISGIRSMAASLPMIFVLIAAIVLYLMMKRVIEQERTQIGVLRAFGYSRLQIVAHYMCYGAVTGVAGGVAGSIMGYFLAEFYFYMFMEYFQMPALSEESRPLYFVVGMLLAVSGGMLGAFMGALKSIRLIPAEAMRPENPPPIKYDPVGKIKVLRYVLTSRGSMALRSITRNWMRSGFVVIGVMFSFGLLCISGSFNGLIDKIMFSQYTYVQRYGVKLPLVRPLPYDTAVESAYAIDAVYLAEGLLEMPAEIRHKHLREGSLLTGIQASSSLYRICDTVTMVEYPPPADSVILSNTLADNLNVVAGDTVYIASPLLDEDVPIIVSRVIEQNMGGGCYMEIGALSDLLQIPKTATSIILNTDDLPYLKDYLRDSIYVPSVDDKDSTLTKLRDMMGIYSSMYLVLQVMSALVGFAIIYNTSTISLAERKREYATLRVIGLTVDEISGIMNFEYWILGFLGMILGVPFVQYLNMGMNAMMETTSFSMPSVLPVSAYASGVAGSAAAILLSGWSAKRRIRKFDMVEVLKERE
ncbi:MAG: FtsX-like permease family protein [Clostridiales bacterium]|nr:FtsX-like permease family protein [Clostridiales bacterium]